MSEFDRNEEVARTIRQDCRWNGRQFLIGEYVALLDADVVAVADGFQAGSFPSPVDVADEVQQLPPHRGVWLEGQVLDFPGQPRRRSMDGNTLEVRS